MSKRIIPMDLHQQLEAAGIPIHGVDELGTISFKDEATDEHKAAAVQLVAAYDQSAVDAQKSTHPAAVVTDEDIDSAKTVADLKALLKRMRK